MAAGAVVAARLIALLEADTSNLDKGLARADTSISKTAQGNEDLGQTANVASSALSAMGKVAATAITVQTVRMTIEFGLELDALAAKAENAGQVFERVYGQDAAGSMELLQNATRGVVDDLKLMQSASLLSTTGLADDLPEAAHILENAMLLGTQINGVTANQALDSILPMLTNQSALRADMFGMSGEQLKELQDKYEEAGLSSAEAFTKAFLEQSDILLEGLEEPRIAGADALATAWANVKLEVAETVDLIVGLETKFSGVADFLGSTADMLRETNQARDVYDSFRGRIDQAVESGYLSSSQGERYNDALNWKWQSIKWGNAEEDDFLAMANEDMEQMLARYPELAGIFSQLDADAAAWAAQIHEADSAVDAVQMRLELMSMRDYAMHISVVADREEWLASVVGMRAEALQEAADRRRNAAIAAIDGTPDLSYLDTVATDYSDANNELEALLAERRSMLESAANTAFTTTSVTSRDWWEVGSGVYEDKPDEYIRRLNAALQDANSEWGYMLGGRSGDAAQLYVAEQTDLWKSGQWSQLGEGFDAGASRQAMLEQIRESVMAQRSREAMIESLINDPALADIGLTGAEQAELTGDAGTWAESLGDSLASTNIGKIVTDTFGEQLEAEEKTWVGFGEMAVIWFASGLKSGEANMAHQMAEALFPIMQEMLQGRS